MDCGPYEEVLNRLKNQYNEIPIGIGVSANQQSIFEILVSPSGSWTIIQTQTNKLSCIMADGKGWIQKKPPIESYTPTSQ